MWKVQKAKRRWHSSPPYFQGISDVWIDPLFQFTTFSLHFQNWWMRCSVKSESMKVIFIFSFAWKCSTFCDFGVKILAMECCPDRLVVLDWECISHLKWTSDSGVEKTPKVTWATIKCPVSVKWTDGMKLDKMRFFPNSNCTTYSLSEWDPLKSFNYLCICACIKMYVLGFEFPSNRRTILIHLQTML